METLQTTISFDDLDLMTTVLEGFTQSLDSDDEDRPAIEALLQNLSEFCDKVESMSEYVTGNDWPESLPLTISCDTAQFKHNA
ncbi:MAG: hypothetical protein IIT68_00320 [Treponema sp.]|nr:hypothetical protein [Treponema sp.]